MRKPERACLRCRARAMKLVLTYLDRQDGTRIYLGKRWGERTIKKNGYHARLLRRVAMDLKEEL